MAGKLVKRVKTPASEDQIIQALVSAWGSIFGDKPTKRQIGMTWAQIAVETGRGSIIWNNNVGNIIYLPGSAYNYYNITDTVSINGDPTKRKKTPMKSRSYLSLEAGIRDYLMLLKNRAPVLQALKSGGPKDFSYALAAVHYYDPPVRDIGVDGKPGSSYTGSLTSIYNEFIKKHSKSTVKQEPQLQPSQAPSEQTADVPSFLSKILKLISYDNSKDKLLLVIGTNSDLSSKLEFARVLNAALKEEFNIQSFTHTDGNNVEVECDLCEIPEIEELSSSLSYIFYNATKKIGNIKSNIIIVPNTRSYYQPLDIKLAEKNYQIFQSKFRKIS